VFRERLIAYSLWNKRIRFTLIRSISILRISYSTSGSRNDKLFMHDEVYSILFSLQPLVFKNIEQFLFIKC
jgi:hypothetical protein